MLVGDGNFFQGFLEVDNAKPVADGFHGIFNDYWKFLKSLRKQDWGPLRKIFEFPVYAVGYNWTGSNDHSGKLLAARIKQIIDEAKGITGLCEKVILLTHSMGGLVSRSASHLHGAEGNILGIIHGVQPVTGAPAAYWRMKAGFEGFGMGSRVLGNSGPTVTPVLGNLPGGLQLLPNKNHVTNRHQKPWLTVTQDGKTRLSLPNSDPYAEIYRVKARVQPTPGEKPSTNKYWGLVDPDLLDPARPAAPPAAPVDPKSRAGLAAAAPPHGDPWQQYLDVLKIAESFHDNLGMYQHPKTFCFAGVNNKTAEVIELRIESNWVRGDPYPKRGFRGFFTDAAGKDMQAVLQDPAGDGDGTVPRASAQALNKSGKEPPGDLAIDVQHQPAYKDSQAQAYAIQAIIALAKVRYESVRGKIKG